MQNFLHFPDSGRRHVLAMRLLYVSWLAAWAEALVSLPKPTRRLLPLRRAEEEQVDPNVREIVSAAMYGTPAEVAAKATAEQMSALAEKVTSVASVSSGLEARVTEVSEKQSSSAQAMSEQIESVLASSSSVTAKLREQVTADASARSEAEAAMAAENVGVVQVVERSNQRLCNAIRLSVCTDT